MSQKETNIKEQKHLILKTLLVLLCLSVVIGIVIYKIQKPQHHLSKTLEAQHMVTKAIANQKLHYADNVVIYDNTTDLKGMIESAKSNVLDKPDITILLYSDGCKRCNRHKMYLAQWAVNHSSKKHVVITVNDDTDIKRLQKYFVIPDWYHYPTALTYSDLNSKQPYQISKRHDLWKDLK